MTNIFQKLSFVVTTTVLSLSVINANPINAASIIYDFEVNNLNNLDGSLVGETYSGFFEFDDSTLTGINKEFLFVSELSFNFLGVNYTETDSLFDTKAIFVNGDFLGLSFFNSSLDGGLLRLQEADFMYSNVEFVIGDITYTLSQNTPKSIPEPTAVFSLLALGAIGSIRILKKGR
jgi:hypothetical protein